MSADHHDHTHDLDGGAPHHAWDSPEEVAHAKLHAKQNILFFLCFLTLIGFAVANYEFIGVDSWWILLGLAAARCALIAAFFVWLIGHYSLIVRTLVFTILFFCGMVFLSLWDSPVPGIGMPIERPGQGPLQTWQTPYKPVAPATPASPQPAP